MITEKKADEQFRPLITEIEGCYAAARATNPSLEGRIVLKLGVWPEGEVISQEIVSSTVNDEPLETCILEAAPRLRFEPLGEGNTASVQMPLIFTPG